VTLFDQLKEEYKDQNLTDEDIRDAILESESDTINQIVESYPDNKDEALQTAYEYYGIPTAKQEDTSTQTAPTDTMTAPTNTMSVTTDEYGQDVVKVPDNLEQMSLIPDITTDVLAGSTMKVKTKEQADEEKYMSDKQSEISDVYSRAKQMHGQLRILNAFDEDIPYAAKNTAISYLMANDIITGVTEDMSQVQLPNGKMAKLDSTFVDDIAEDAYSLLLAAETALITETAVASKLPAPPQVKVGYAAVATLIGSATGFGTGEVQRKMENAKFFDVELDPKDYFKAYTQAFFEDISGYGIAASAKKVGEVTIGAIGEKYNRVYNALVNNDLDGAYDTLWKTSARTDEEKNIIIEKAAAANNEPIPLATSREGKLKRMEYLAKYDNSLNPYLKNATGMSIESVSDITKAMRKRTDDLSNAIGEGRSDIVRLINETDQVASDIYGAMTQNMSNAFSGITIDPANLQGRLGSVISMLKKNKATFTESTQAAVEKLIQKSEEIGSIDDLIAFNKTYNRAYRKLFKSGNLDKKELDAIKAGAKLTKGEVYRQIDKLPTLTASEKTKLKLSFANANQAVSTAKDAIDTNLFGRMLVSKKSTDVKASNNVIDQLISAAKRTSIDPEKSPEFIRVMSTLSEENIGLVEASMLNRIVEKYTDEGISDFGKILSDARGVSNLLTSQKARAILEQLEKFDVLFANDAAMAAATGLNVSTKLAPAGLSKSTVESTKYALNSNFFRKVQLVLPAILREVGVGRVPLVKGVLETAEENAVQAAVEINVHNAIRNAKTMPDMFSEILKVENLPPKARITVLDAFKSYGKLNEAISKIPIEERIEYVKSFKDNRAKYRAVEGIRQEIIKTPQTALPEKIEGVKLIDAEQEAFMREKRAASAKDFAEREAEYKAKKIAEEQKAIQDRLASEEAQARQEAENAFANYEDVYGKEVPKKKENSKVGLFGETMPRNDTIQYYNKSGEITNITKSEWNTISAGVENAKKGVPQTQKQKDAIFKHLDYINENVGDFDKANTFQPKMIQSQLDSQYRDMTPEDFKAYNEAQGIDDGVTLKEDGTLVDENGAELFFGKNTQETPAEKKIRLANQRDMYTFVTDLRKRSKVIDDFIDNEPIGNLFKFGDDYAYKTLDHKILVGDTAKYPDEKLVTVIEHEIDHFHTVGYIGENFEKGDVRELSSAIDDLILNKSNIYNKLTKEQAGRLRKIFDETNEMRRLSEAVSVLREPDMVNILSKAANDSRGRLKKAIVAILNKAKKFIFGENTKEILVKNNVDVEGMVNKINDLVIRGKEYNAQGHKVAGVGRAKAAEKLDGKDALEGADYRMEHKAPMRDGANTGDNLADIFPDDIYSSKGATYYGTGDRAMDNKSVAIIASMRNKPEKEVTIYRAVPKGVKDINEGDWITINKDYAKQHGESYLEDGYEIVTKKVKAKDITTNGDSIHEWGYYPM
jgi:hypothetical protein